MTYIYIGFGGIVGGVLRYLFSVIPLAPLGITFPFATLFVNCIGSFFLGLLSFRFLRSNWPESIKKLITTGLLGSFTTFSAFSVEVIQMMQKQLWFLSIFYIVFSLIGGFCFMFLGYKLANKKSNAV